MRQVFETADQETPPKTKKELTCPLCRSPLIGEAIKAGKCQCCGHRFDPEELKSQQK
jgi:hypothetical protein